MEEVKNSLAIIADSNRPNTTFAYVLATRFGLAAICIDEITNFDQASMKAVKLVVIVDGILSPKVNQLIDYISTSGMEIAVAVANSCPVLEFNELAKKVSAIQYSLDSFEVAIKHLLELENSSLGEYSPIRSHFCLAHPLPDDLYLMLSSGRFVKLFSAKDVIHSDDIAKYVEKGISTFYVKWPLTSWQVKKRETNNTPGSEGTEVDFSSDLKETITSLKADILGEAPVVEKGPFSIEQEYLHTIREKIKTILDNLKKK